MKSTRLRYDDKELVIILQKLAFDHMIKPSQRIVTADHTAPTHHTYVKRFGSINDAIEVAGLSNMINSIHYHQLLIGELKRDGGIKTINEFVQINGITVNAQIITNNGEVFYLDVVWLDNVDEEIINYHKEIRAIAMADAGYYIQMASMIDIIGETKRLKEEFIWV